MTHRHKNRAAQVAPKEGKWEAYFTDAPRERCLGCTPEEALGRLRALTNERRDVVKTQVDRTRKSDSRGRIAIFATIAVIGTIAAVVIQHAENNTVAPEHVKMYAHHRLLSDVDSR